jgi:hypothetical protein
MMGGHWPATWWANKKMVKAAMNDPRAAKK